MRDWSVPAVVATALVVGCVTQVASAHHHVGQGWHHLIVTGAVMLLAAALVAAAVPVLVAVARHRQVVRTLRRVTSSATVAGHQVREGPLPQPVFVAGLGRPEIYLDPEVADRLTGSQLAAVLAHEEAHRRRRDPLRQLLLGTLVAPLVRGSRRGRRWLEIATARREVSADVAALEAGASRAALAGALLVVGGEPRPGVAAFGPASDLRLRALLDGQPVPAASVSGPTVVRLLAVPGAAMVACAWFLHAALVGVMGG